MSRRVIHDHITLSTTIGNNVKNVIYPKNTSLDVLLQSSNPAIAEYGELLIDIINRLGVLAFFNSIIDDSTPNGYRLASADVDDALEIVSDEIDPDLFNPDTMIKISDVREAMSIPDGEEFPFVVGDYVVPDGYSSEYSWSALKCYEEIQKAIEICKDYTLSKEEIEERLGEIITNINDLIETQNTNIAIINNIINNNIDELDRWRNELLRNINIVSPDVTGTSVGDISGIISTENIEDSSLFDYRGLSKWKIINDDRKYSLFVPSELEPNPPDGAKQIISSYISCHEDDEGSIEIVSNDDPLINGRGVPVDTEGNPTITNPKFIPVCFIEGDPKFRETAIGSPGSYVRRYTTEEFGDMTGKVPYDEVRFDIHVGNVICSTEEVSKYVVDFKFDYDKNIYLSEINGAADICTDITTHWCGTNEYWLSSWNPPNIVLMDATDLYHLEVTRTGIKINKDESRIKNYFSDGSELRSGTHTDMVHINGHRIYQGVPVAYSTVEDDFDGLINLGYHTKYDENDGLSFFGPNIPYANQ